MTISARRAALLGLTVPLSAIMLAVLGLWPEEEDDEPPHFDIGTGIGLGGGGKPDRKKTTVAAKKKPADQDEDFMDRQRRMFERNRAAIAAIIAVAEAEGLL